MLLITWCLPVLRCQSTIFRNAFFPVPFGPTRYNRYRIGKTDLSKNAIGAMKRAAAAGSLRPDARVSAAASARSFPDSLSSAVTPFRRMKMKAKNSLLIATAVAFGILISTGASAKTAKDCKAEWQAYKAGMQSRGVTQKAYIEQCKGGAEPTATAPSVKPKEAPAPTEATAGGSKTAKACKEEWQADKAGMKARGVTQRAYVEQ